MKGLSKQEEANKKVTEVNTFPVPYSLEEIEENITITMKSDAKPSKETILNQAFKFHSKGNVAEAAKYYRYFIDQGFLDHRVFSNYGVILRNQGKLKEAEKSYRKAIEIKPDFADALYNIGIILKDLGNLKEAELSARKAIELNPNFANAHNTLGNILVDLGNLKEAELSARKAIELNPDFAEAHYNLVNILKALGKLEELVLISKSALELKSMNQADKLCFTCQITIASFLRGNFSETFLNIKKTNHLISQGIFNTIRSQENIKHLSTYHQFITSLYPQIEKNNYNSEIIPHFGESNCLSFAHQSIPISSQIKKIQPVLIRGGKAWHFSNNKNNQWKDSLAQQIKNHTYSKQVFISFGDIDCRKDEGILPYAIKNNIDISEVCKKTINGYLKYMEITLSQYYSKRFYFGIPAPTRKKTLADALDVKRVELIKIYNSLLKKEVLSGQAYFIDVYELTSTINGINNNIHMCDEYHLSPKCLSILFEKHLYKPDSLIV